MDSVDSEQYLPDDYVDPDYGKPEEPSAVLERLRGCRSDLAPFNRLLSATEGFLEGEVDRDEVQAALEAADQELGQLRLQFQDALRFQEPNSHLERNTPVVWAMFALLQEQFEAFESALDQGKLYEATIALQESNAAINQMFWAFGDLKRNTDKLTYSESPYVNELVRVARACQAGTLAAELLQERLEAFVKMHQSFVAGVEQMASVGVENPVVGENLPRLQAALAEQTEGLEELQAFLDTADPAHIDAGVELILGATQVMLAQQKTLVETPEEVSVRICFKCGKESPAEARVCTACNSRFPEQGPQSVQAAGTLSFQDGASTRGAVGANIQKLVDAVAAVRRNEMTLEEFAQTVDWFEGVLEKVIERFENMEDPTEPPTIPPEQWAIFEEATSAMEQGLTEMRGSVRKLRDYLAHRDPQLLDFAVEQCLEASDKMLRLQAINQSVST